ncbi:MAG TPA: molybdopterin biosynthesis protein [Aliiroseovarius sp.]|nr:molybdopterin biosynthesis protein [Aliiroseovarius sp.]
MQFAAVPLAQASGAILAHSQQIAGGRLRKGLILQEEHLDALRASGLREVVVARLGPGDLGEDAAALRLGRALLGEGLRLSVATGGRVNLFAEGPGVLEVSRARVDALNNVDPMITLATLPEWSETAPDGLVATVKIISYGVGEAALEQACQAGRGALPLHRPRLPTAALIQTGNQDKLFDKGRRALASRLGRFDARLIQHETVAHEVEALAQALAQARGDVLFILTHSATSDINDVAPTALRQAGGHVERFGMPVDPGNLLFIGALGGRPVIGLPGCARSLALNGADWVMARVLCGITVSADDIAGMGVGGLLKEMPSRPQPRET